MPVEYLDIASEPNFLLIPEKPFIETWEWNTNIIQTQNGNEQRIAYKEYPRIYYRATCSVLYNIDYIIWRKYMFNSLGGITRFLLPQYCFYLTGSADPRSRSVYFKQEYYNFDKSDEICIVNEEETEFSYGKITQISGNSITLQAPPKYYHPAGNRVYPIAYMRILDDSSFRMNSITGLCDLNLLDVYVRITNPVSVPPNITCDEKLVLWPMPLNISGMSTAYTRQYHILDNEISQPIFYSKYERSFHTFSNEWYINREDNVTLLWWKYFLYSIRGQQQHFLMPSWQHDFIGSLSNYAGDIINLDGTEFLDIYYKHDGTKYLHINATNGNHYCRVTSATESSGGGVTIKVDPPISRSGNERIGRISLLYLVRLNDDAVTFTHEDRHSIVRLSMRTINE